MPLRAANPNSLASKDIEAPVDKEDQPCFKHANVEKLLGMCNIDISTSKPGEDDKQVFH